MREYSIFFNLANPKPFSDSVDTWVVDTHLQLFKYHYANYCIILSMHI